MSRVATRITGSIVSLALAASLATTAFAALRSPQVPVLGGSLQAYLNSKGEAINVNTDQNDVQTWSTTPSNNSAFTLMIELSASAAANTYGIYNGANPAPPLYLVFPGAASAGWFATASFRNAPVRVVVNLFDNNGLFVAGNTYLGADASNFGYYLSGPNGLFYSQDARNPGGLAQMLTYAGTGSNSGSWWLCMEDQSLAAGSDQDFDDAVLFLESVNPTPVHTTSWGQVKARFR
jgi:hypothetical protein